MVIITEAPLNKSTKDFNEVVQTKEQTNIVVAVVRKYCFRSSFLEEPKIYIS